ncbi:hypothetical protein [Anaerosalibacter massiliensis]|uniref:Uncharacterized protein n=1 Tax=Anaerosalibacter massiliensis TaxID=1347392 RepID=A0A9X2S596_9FIRM|nr:hypothetical protein [Anaerosalibacter massiliensis]MCR2044099.1 hypothetical protein [Anaerosalibacter massiliensis]
MTLTNKEERVGYLIACSFLEKKDNILAFRMHIRLAWRTFIIELGKITTF